METLTTAKWAIDTLHSEVQFKVKHLVISTVTGSFKKFEGALETTSDDFNGADAAFSIDVDSIDTNVPDRDAHLKSNDFFNAAEFPSISFNGKLRKNDEDDYALIGDLTVRNITKEVQFPVEYGGQMVDGYGQTKAGFEINGIINRKEFGLTWDMVTEAGGVVVSEDVKLQLNVQVTLS